MGNPLFSTYSQGENRVTATILAVFERLSFAIVEQILQSILEEPETKLVNFQNQPTEKKSVPDARIFASFSYWIETKIAPDAIRISQIRNHLVALDDPKNSHIKMQRLLILTPDFEKPSKLSEIEDERVVWSNFENLVTAIQETIQIDEDWFSSNSPLPSENERELLRELVHFLSRENLIGVGQDRVLIVAARVAYQDYEQYGIYFCQPNRTFQSSSHIGFYNNGQIEPIFPQIKGSIENIRVDENSVLSNADFSSQEKENLLSVINELEKEENSILGTQVKVIFLSESNSSETLKLQNPIQNNLHSDSGRRIAFTQGQRYVSLEAIKSEPITTKELLKRSNL